MVELRRRREGLERRRDGMLSRTGNNDPGGGNRCGSGSAVSGGSGASLSAATSALDSGEASPNADDSGFATSSNELDRMEAHETVRMHLDEMRREEAELDF